MISEFDGILNSFYIHPSYRVETPKSNCKNQCYKMLNCVYEFNNRSYQILEVRDVNSTK